MRATTTLLLTPLLLVACKIDLDPLDSLTQGVTGDSSQNTESGTSGASAASAASEPTTTTTGNSGQTSNDPSDGTGGTGNTDPGTTTQTSAPATSGPTSVTTTTTGEPTDPYETARQVCVDTINMYRAMLGLPPYARWTDAEKCSDDEAASDGASNTPHGAFGMCGEWAQNECPGWPGPPEESLPQCLAQMWAEGPGDDFNTHGHYINMSSEMYTRVACGFAEVNGEFWMIQNFQ